MNVEDEEEEEVYMKELQRGKSSHATHAMYIYYAATVHAHRCSDPQFLNLAFFRTPDLPLIT